MHVVVKSKDSRARLPLSNPNSISMWPWDKLLNLSMSQSPHLQNWDGNFTYLICWL